MLKKFFWIIIIIIEAAITIFAITKIYKEYKLSKTIDEKILFFLILFIFLVPLLIYYIDIYDIPSKFNWLKNSFSERWFNFITTYISSIFGAVIGAVVLILMTIHQMDRQDEKDKETLRINNMPLLSYEISRNAGEINLENLFITNCEKGNSVDFELKIKNLGMNAIKKAFIEFSSIDFSSSYYNWLASGGCIDKGDSIKIYRYLEIPEGKHLINATIYYCDLINNWYSQTVIIELESTNQFDKTGCIFNFGIVIEDEKFIKGAPKDLMKLL